MDCGVAGGGAGARHWHSRGHQQHVARSHVLCRRVHPQRLHLLHRRAGNARGAVVVASNALCPLLCNELLLSAYLCLSECFSCACPPICIYTLRVSMFLLPRTHSVSGCVCCSCSVLVQVSGDNCTMVSVTAYVYCSRVRSYVCGSMQVCFLLLSAFPSHFFVSLNVFLVHVHPSVYTLFACPCFYYPGHIL